MLLSQASSCRWLCARLMQIRVLRATAAEIVQEDAGYVHCAPSCSSRILLCRNGPSLLFCRDGPSLLFCRDGPSLLFCRNGPSLPACFERTSFSVATVEIDVLLRLKTSPC